MIYHLPDLESDFSRYHRIDDLDALDGPRFMRFAWRIAAYGGMVARRIEAQNYQPEPTTPAPTAPAHERREVPRRQPAQVARLAPPGSKVVSAVEMAFLHPGLVDIRKVSKEAPPE